MQILAEDLAVAKLRAENAAVTAICSVCGYVVKGPNAVVKCPVCGGGPEAFTHVDRKAVEQIATAEGGIAEEEVMPGVTVRWANDAREGLREVTDAYLRRRAKARIEKYARTRKLPVITKEVAFPLIEETVGRDKLGDGWDTLIANTKFAAATLKDVTDPNGAFTWTEDAVARLNRVPAGLMRDMTREAIEKVAREAGRPHRPRGVRGGDRARPGHDERGHCRLHQEQAPELRRANGASAGEAGSRTEPASTMPRRM